MNLTVFERTYDSLEERLTCDENISVKVYKKATGKVYPMVVVKQINYSHFSKTYKTSVLGVEVDIFAKEAMMNGERKLVLEVAEYISSIVDEHMSGMGYMLRGCVPTPHVDDTIYRITMRYDATIDDYRNRIY